MRRNIITALTLFFVVTLLFSANLSKLAYANENEEADHIQEYNHPVSSPVPEPITGPVTGPITGPAEVFAISGNISYRFWGLFKHGMGRIMPAAEGITVKAFEIFGHTSVTTTTDSQGNYILHPGHKGWYQVSATGGKASFYAPASHFVNDNKPEGKNHVDFQGVLFNF